jgi:hypothetical protein
MQITIAENLLQTNLSTQEIAKHTHLAIEQVEGLRNKNKEN